MNKKDFIVFKCDVFRATVLLMAGYTDKELEHRLDKHFDGIGHLDRSCNAGGCFVIKDNKTMIGTFCVWIRDRNDRSNLIHECVHLAWFIASNHGIRITEDQDDFIAYYQGYWLRRFYKALYKEDF